MRALRVLYILKIFMDKTDKDKRLSVSQLMSILQGEGFSASRNTVKEDIRTLIEAGYRLVESKARSNVSYYYLESEFTFEELKIILDGIYSNKFITPEVKGGIKAKLLGSSSFREKTKIGNMIRTDSLDTGFVNVMDNLAVINSSIDERRVISFDKVTRDYNKNIVKRGEVKDFIAKEVYYHNDRYYLIGYNREGEIRHYRVDRIFNLEKGIKHNNLAKIDMKDYSLKNFDMFATDRQEKLELKVKKPLINSIVETLGSQASIHRCLQDQDCFIVSATLGVNKGLIRWILKQGSDLEVLYPESLRKLVREELQRTINLYGEDSSPR